MFPLVSIIIPVYNSERNLLETLKSVVSQDYERLQIIIVLNGSTDSSSEIISTFKDERFLVLKLEINQGPVGAKNHGLKYANGKYVQFLDSDDILSKNKIGDQVNFLEQNPKCVAVCRTIHFEHSSQIELLGKENEICTEFLYTTNSPLDFLLNLFGINGKDGMIQPNAYLIPLELINKAGIWDKRLEKSPDDDSEFMTRVIMNSNGIIYCNQGINYYRKIPNSNATSNIRTLESSLAALLAVELRFNFLLTYSNDVKLIRLFHRQLALIAYNYGRNHAEIIWKVKDKLNELNSIFRIEVGGIRFQILSRIIGFFNLLYLIYWFNRIKVRP